MIAQLDRVRSATHRKPLEVEIAEVISLLAACGGRLARGMARKLHSLRRFDVALALARDAATAS